MSDSVSLRALLDDLHKLEINTIEKAAMTAQKMPAPLLALFETIEGYESHMDWAESKTRFDYAQSNAMRAGNTPNDSLADRLEKLKERADARFKLLADAATDEERIDRMICGRIGRSSESMLGMLERAGKATANAPRQEKTGPIDPDCLAKTAAHLRAMDSADVEKAWQLSPTDRAFLRKMWEIGTEKVLIQTVVQIEGDVITRISPLVLKGDNKHLLEIHRNAIETSVEMWGVLVGVAERLVGGVARALGQTIGLGR